MQVNSINFNTSKPPVFRAKLDSKLRYYAQKDPRYDEFIKQFSKWGDSNTVVGIYNAKINGKLRYMLRLRNEVLGSPNVRITNDEPEYMESKLADKIFNLTSKDIDFAEYALFRNVKRGAKEAGLPYVEQLKNIIKSSKTEGRVFDADTLKLFKSAE